MKTDSAGGEERPISMGDTALAQPVPPEFWPDDSVGTPDRSPESEWIEATQIGIVMKGMRSSWPAALTTVVVINALAALYVPVLALMAWTLTWLALAAHRYMYMRRYQRVVSRQPSSERLAYFRRYAWIWVMYAASWGVLPLVLADRLPDLQLIIVWITLGGAGAVSMSWMSAYLPTVRRYLSTLVVTMLACVAFNMLTGAVPRFELVLGTLMPMMVALFLVIMTLMVNNLHRMSTQSIDLRYQNERLIQSLRQQTQTAQQALVFRDRYLAGAAHDLKQPINALAIYAEWLCSEPELVDELSPKILQSTQAVNTLFDSLFDLVKLDAGHLSVDVKPIKVKALLSDLMVQFRPLAIQKGLKLRSRPLDLVLHSDPIMLRRIVSNLVSNAIRYTPHGGILLAVRQRHSEVVFEVWDTGIGIAEGEQAMVFEEFYKVKVSGTEGGFGLGLSIVRRLSATLGCTLTMQSVPGRGSVFRLRVPLSSGVAVTNSAGHSSGRNAASAFGS
ncbi:sensor histidine kinase [Ottowia sp.]|uniref:sensor histidine kinase n=1 Tax=Ottowia sp. TaxID=1898956 RepID=UPI003A89EEA3